MPVCICGQFRKKSRVIRHSDAKECDEVLNASNAGQLKVLNPSNAGQLKVLNPSNAGQLKVLNPSNVGQLKMLNPSDIRDLEVSNQSSVGEKRDAERHDIQCPNVEKLKVRYS